MKQFKYKSIFNNCFVKASAHSEIDKYLSEASLEELRKLDLPKSINLEKNLDLVAAIYNGAVINRMNGNGDAIATDTILKIKDLFLHKPTNIEHKKSRTVGHIVQVGFSSFKQNKLLTEEEVSNLDEPFNLVIGSVVYRLNEQRFSNMLVESSDETSDLYNTISASWEIAFDNYHIMVGSKNVNEATIISDPEEIKQYEKYLKQNGGKGKTPDGEIVGRLIVGEAGEVIPSGFGYTSNPAAEVQGVTLIDFSDLLESDKNEEDSSEASEVSDNEQEAEIQEKNIKNKKNISTSNEKMVNNHEQRVETMNIKTIEDLLALMPQEVSEANKDSVTSFIKKGIEEANEEWEQKLQEKEDALAQAQKEIDSLKSESESNKSEADKLSERLQKIEQELGAKEAEAKYQERMAAIASEFVLSDQEKAVLAKKVKSFASDEEYENWYEEFSVFASDKKKETIEAKNKEIAELKEAYAKLSEKEQSAASQNTPEENTSEQNSASSNEEELNTKEEEAQSLASSVSSSEQRVSLADEFKDAFEGKIKVKYN